MKKVKLLYIGNILSEFGNTPGTIETLGPLLEKEGFEIIYGGNKFSKPKRLIEMLHKTIKYGKKVDYVLIDTYSTSAFWFAWAVGNLCRILNVKYIPILHGGDLPTRLNQSPFFCKQLFGKSFKNVAVSNYLHSAFKKHNFDSIIIPNNIDLSVYKFKNRSTFQPKLLWVRSFNKNYNPKMAIMVMKELSKIYANACLCMIGPDKDGTLQEMKALTEELNLSDRIEFTGRLSKDDWHKKSEDYDIFINTTNYDNFPVSVVEGIALGLPIISTNVGGIPYLLNNDVDSILVPKNDVDAMVSGIIKVCNDSVYSKSLVTNAFNKIQDFDWVQVKSLWINLLR